MTVIPPSRFVVPFVSSNPAVLLKPILGIFLKVLAFPTATGLVDMARNAGGNENLAALARPKRKAGKLARSCPLSNGESSPNLTPRAIIVQD